MKIHEFTRRLDEAVAQPDVPQMDRNTAKQAIHAMGYEDVVVNGNILRVLVQIPDGKKKNEFRKEVMTDILTRFQHEFPDQKPAYKGRTPALGSLGGIVFDNSPVGITIKDSGVQGEKSAGVANEAELAALIQSVLGRYKTANVTFVDPRGKYLAIENVVRVELTGKDVKARKKADVVLHSKSGNHLPVSLKQLDAETWESADRFFGAKAREIIDNLVEQGVLKLIPLDNPPDAFALSKEVVIEPTEEEAMMTIFGSDINPEGGIVIQTFKPEHFTQEGNNIQVACHAVIHSKEDIPESHMMVWLLRNNATRLSKSLGIRGIRPMASVLTRAIGRKGDKDVILVDKDGNVIRS